MRARDPKTIRPLSRECAAPPKPVWGNPDGMVAAPPPPPAADPVPVEPSPLDVLLPVVTVPVAAPVEPPVPVELPVPVGVGVVAVGEVPVGVVTAQVEGVVMVLASRVTAPLRANTRPWTVAPVSSVADVSAMMVPTKLLAEFKVAELPTCQNTLHA